MPAAVLPQNQLRLRNPDRMRIDDLVSGLLLQVTILMDARFVRERILSHDSLVRLRPKSDGLRQKLAGRVNMLGNNLGLERQLVAARLERYHNLFERCISRPLPDAVDGALDLARAR